MALRIGRFRRGISGSAIAAAAMAALTASQAPEVLGGEAPAAPEPPERPSAAEAPDIGLPEDGQGKPYHTDLPPLDTSGPGQGGGADAIARGPAEAGIPATVLDAYRQAEATLARTTPGCNLEWELLAAIGKVESGHARAGAVDADGTTPDPILGPVLNGDGFARILDTDDGRWDGDTVYDRAVGPMQFIPSTWASWGADGNGDGRSDPNNVYDAALAAGDYLCAANRDLSVSPQLDRALLSYNQSWDYVRTVRSWLDYYRQGAHEVPDGEGRLPSTPGAGNPHLPVGGKGGGTGTGSGAGSGSGTGSGTGTGTGGGPGKGEDRPAPPPPAESDGGIEFPRPEQPEQPGTEEPEEPGTGEPEEPGTEEPGTEEPPECPTDPEDPGTEDPEEPGTEEPGTEEPGEPGEPDGTGTPEPSPTPTPGTDGPEDPETPEDPEEPGTGEPEEPGDPEDPDACGDPEEPGTEEPEEPGTEEPEDPEESGTPSPRPTASESAAPARRDG
ncbi:lytic transglycosylase domain-containing protein [Streptomyces marincola]|uniref:lytic transglycosylase domain-containing protein n=1 Tax=Streptomyces marincola TaxID=2878388 RepID=UPI001CF24772|nr:lytic transglycosylase domain-containing protein [Streptomyces marincola]UCM87294.1 lytic transglycosylase domain-containing protein [Streptomyces marincola]